MGHSPRAIAILTLSILVNAGAQDSGRVVSWTGKAVPMRSFKPGDKLTVTLEATIAAGWHVYSISQPPGGPVNTEIAVPAGQPFKLAGPINGPRPQSAYDSNFEMKTEFYEHSAAFQVPLIVTSGAKHSGVAGVMDVRFQACNERLCLPPETVHVPLGSDGAGRTAKGGIRKQAPR